MDDPASTLERLREDLTAAMRAGDRHAVTALRTALAAIANAEAPPDDGSAAPAHGRLVEHERLVLTADDVAGILRHQITDREDTLRRIAAAGRPEAVDALRAEIAVLARYAPAPGGGGPALATRG